MSVIENHSQLEFANAPHPAYHSVVPTSAVAPSAAPAAVSLVDSLLSTSGRRLQDQLFDLRAALLGLGDQPELSVKAFLRLRPLLDQKSYLTRHRLRRLLETAVQLEVTTPEGTHRRAIDLSWGSLDLLLNAARRDAFERGDGDWNQISVRLVSR